MIEKALTVVHINVRYRLPFQSVDATHAANRSAGVSKSNVFRLSWLR